jgi:hypothetical protein
MKTKDVCVVAQNCIDVEEKKLALLKEYGL